MLCVLSVKRLSWCWRSNHVVVIVASGLACTDDDIAKWCSGTVLSDKCERGGTAKCGEGQLLERVSD